MKTRLQSLEELESCLVDILHGDRREKVLCVTKDLQDNEQNKYFLNLIEVLTPVMDVICYVENWVGSLANIKFLKDNNIDIIHSDRFRIYKYNDLDYILLNGFDLKEFDAYLMTPISQKIYVITLQEPKEMSNFERTVDGVISNDKRISIKDIPTIYIPDKTSDILPLQYVNSVLNLFHTPSVP